MYDGNPLGGFSNSLVLDCAVSQPNFGPNGQLMTERTKTVKLKIQFSHWKLLGIGSWNVWSSWSKMDETWRFPKSRWLSDTSFGFWNMTHSLWLIDYELLHYYDKRILKVDMEMKFSIRYHWRTEFIRLEVIGKTVHSVIMCISSKTFNGHWPQIWFDQEAHRLPFDSTEKYLSLVDTLMLSFIQCELEILT